MTSLLQRFRERQNRAQEFTLQYPTEDPQIELTVRRMPEPFLDNARAEAEGDLRKRGIKAADPEWSNEYGAAFAYALVGQLSTHAQRHVLGWKAVDGGALPTYSPGSFQGFVETLVMHERVMLGLAYFLLTQEDAKKNSPEPTSDPAS